MNATTTESPSGIAAAIIAAGTIAVAILVALFALALGIAVSNLGTGTVQDAGNAE